jgi:8-oxo-dGTP diphosphatase
VKKIKLAGCIILREGKILLLKRKKGKWYEMPGGKLEGNESPEEGARRELKEELLCEINIIKNLGEKSFVEKGAELKYTWFSAKIKQGFSPKLGEPEKFDYFKYLPIDKLRNYNLSSNMKNLLFELQNGNILLK